MRTGVFARILNVAEEFINPATEEKQDDIISAQTGGSQKIRHCPDS